MAIGTAVANAANVVGNHLVKAAETKFSKLGGAIKAAANEIGSTAVSVGNSFEDFGEMVADATVDLAGAVLDAAVYSVNQGIQLAEKVGSEIASKAVAFGDVVQSLGPLVVGLAKAAWEVIKDFLLCFKNALSPCAMLIGEVCDCKKGSAVAFSNGLSLKCVFKDNAGLTKKFGFKATQKEHLFGGKGANGKVKLPGEEYSRQGRP
ncbi:unnamed protein product [Symbiodinium natans]|uniref:Uncharacterized protein n=1 Tax=Symbiodinium natans TaxID=878477 RepID=A0A812IH79_9DINO|nr:unnamed protein product [Symbiodinium natans]